MATPEEYGLKSFLEVYTITRNKQIDLLTRLDGLAVEMK